MAEEAPSSERVHLNAPDEDERKGTANGTEVILKFGAASKRKRPVDLASDRYNPNCGYWKLCAGQVCNAYGMYLYAPGKACLWCLAEPLAAHSELLSYRAGHRDLLTVQGEACGVRGR